MKSKFLNLFSEHLVSFQLPVLARSLPSHLYVLLLFFLLDAQAFAWDVSGSGCQFPIASPSCLHLTGSCTGEGARTKAAPTGW